MTKAAIDQRASSAAPRQGPSPSSRKQKLSSFLVTSDVDLWPQVGCVLTQKLNHRQIDSVEELISTTARDQPGVVLWDARDHADQGEVLARLQEHSARFAVVALDHESGDATWQTAVAHGQIVGFVPVPIDPEHLSSTLASACEEANARVALLGDAGAPAEPPAASTMGAPGGVRERSRLPLLVAAAGGVIACVAAAVYFSRDTSTPPVPPPQSAAAARNEAAAPAIGAATEEKVDALIDQAQRAMRDRHFIDPTDGSALSLYRSALALDPASGEARQGLKRLAEILLARVQSALEERQFDAALQALESARSINPDDARLPALDERIAKMRAELGPVEILAAINAKNFDRAAQLIDGAARSKAVGDQKLNQLREELKRHRSESDVAGLIELIDARMQQDQLDEPANDNAAYYIGQAKHAGATSADLDSRVRELSRRLTLAAHAAIGERRLGDADKLAADMKSIGAPVAALAAVQREIAAARTEQHPPPQSDQTRLLDLARSKLAQGSVIEPENDNALYYLNQLRASDPQNVALPQLSKSIQTQILEQARSALSAGQSGQAETLLQLASVLGPCAELDALNDRLHTTKLFAAGAPKEVAEASLTRTRKLDIDYPQDALERRIEGTVEIGFTVTAKGAVSDIKVLDANPSGVFDKAATNAVARLRYQPVVEDGKPVAVTTKILVKFRLAT